MDVTVSSLSRRNPPRRRVRPSLVLCVLSLCVCTALAGLAVAYRQNQERRAMERLLEEKSALVTGIATRLAHKAQALKALVIRTNGAIDDFDVVAPVIADDPSIHNILIAPGGIVSHVYPPDGSERLVGFNLFGSGNGNREAIMAREKGEFVLAGPFALVEGGRGIAGRLPVFIGSEAGKPRFWGLVSVTLNYPDALDEARLDDLEYDGFAYELWRVSLEQGPNREPDDGTDAGPGNGRHNGGRQSIASGGRPHAASASGLERPITMYNAEWLLRIVPVRDWYERPDSWLLFLVGFCISALVWVVVRNGERLVHVKRELACLLDKDALTGALNRTGLFHVLEGLIAGGAPFALYYFDLNHFKHINDTYGHNVGDRVLVTFCRRLEKHLTRRHALARMSGDEFILVHAPSGHSGPGALSGEDEQDFWSRVEYEFSRPIAGDAGESFTLSFSTGKAVFPEDGGDIDALIRRADLRMYEQKRIKYDNDLKRRYTDGP